MDFRYRYSVYYSPGYVGCCGYRAWRPFREGRIDGRRPDRFRGRREYRREKLSNTEVRKRLKGEEGTIVKVGVLRGHENMDFRIIRGKIPIYSIDATYMLDKTTGYIKLSRFAATTIDEFEEAVKNCRLRG